MPHNLQNIQLIIDQHDVAVAACVETAVIGIDADYGSLDAGRYGNVVLVDDKLDILKVVRHGEVIG